MNRLLLMLPGGSIASGVTLNYHLFLLNQKSVCQLESCLQVHKMLPFQ